MKHFIYSTVLLVLGSFALPSTSIALPNEIVQEGLLTTRNGQRMEGVHTIRVSLYTGLRGGQRLFDEVHRNVEIVGGYYSIAIGSIQTSRWNFQPRKPLPVHSNRRWG